MPKKYAPIIKKAKLFSGVSNDDLIKLLNCLRAAAVKFSKGSMIFVEGGEASGIGIVCEGTVQIVRDDIFGNRSIIEQLNKGDLFGEAFACAQVKYLPVGVTALTDCVVVMINFRKIISTCTSACVFHSRLIENMLSAVAEKNLTLTQKIEILSARSTRDKILVYLSAQSVKEGSASFSIPFNRQQLADYISVDRSAMSAELSRMRADGLIKYDKNRFTLLRSIN